MYPDDLGAISGMIVHTRTQNWFGKKIRSCLSSWGNHDAILIAITPALQEKLKLNFTGWAVAEAVAPRFTITPWDVYCERIMEKKTSVVFLYHPKIKVHHYDTVISNTINMFLKAPRYDYIAIGIHLFNTIFEMNLTLHCHWTWYCTEAVSDIYHGVNFGEFDVWHEKGKFLPTPYTTEKRCMSQDLCVLGEIIAKDQPSFLATYNLQTTVPGQ